MPFTPTVPGATGGRFGPPVLFDLLEGKNKNTEDKNRRPAEQAVQADTDKRQVFGFVERLSSFAPLVRAA